MDWGIIISVIALIFSIFTFLVNDYKIKKQERLINEYEIDKIKAEKKEIKKAIIKANAIKADSGKIIIKVFNSGKSVGNNIRFEILSDNDRFFININEVFPFEFLNPQESTEVMLHTFIGSPDKIKIRLTWDDDDLDNMHEQILTL